MNTTAATILVVDDIESNRDALRELLDSPDYLLIEAANGATALQLAKETPPDLVLLDVMMPVMDGYEVCRRLRADARLAEELPVVMVTALDDQASRIKGIRQNADDFITEALQPALKCPRAERVHHHTPEPLSEAERISGDLRESDERFPRALFDLGPVAIYSCDAAGTISGLQLPRSS